MPEQKGIIAGQPNPHRKGPRSPIEEYQRDGVEPRWDSTLIRKRAQQEFGLIRIKQAPSGEAPLEIREKWIGVFMLCEPEPDETGVLVLQDRALFSLGCYAPEAAAWWKVQGYPKPGEYFHFGFSEVLIIRGLSLFAKIRHVPEEARVT